MHYTVKNNHRPLATCQSFTSIEELQTTTVAIQLQLMQVCINKSPKNDNTVLTV